MAGVDVHHYPNIQAFCQERMAPNCGCEFSVRRNRWLLRCRQWAADGVFQRLIYCYLTCVCPNSGSLQLPPEVPEVNQWLRGPPLPGLAIAEGVPE